MQRGATIPRTGAGRFGWVLAFLLFLAGCAGGPGGDSPVVQQPAGKGEPFVLWMLSDIQAKTAEERQAFEKTIDDVNAQVPRVDMGVIAGDLMASRSRDEAFSWFLNTRNRSKARHWFELAGNHDARSQPLFNHYFPRPAAYGVEFGNVLVLLLADTVASSATEISDAAFAWWRDMVLGNQQRIIITVSHAQLEESGLLGSSIADRRIDRSARFEDVLRHARVDVWASGHCHLPHWLPATVSIQEELGGTCFINVSAIQPGMLMDSQSRLFFFTEDSDTLLIRSRNHTAGRFQEGRDVVIRLSKPFVRGEKEPRVISGPR
ncbi:MAG: metallophosphoesterase [Desulforhopalus sp.]|nr:metallophosphoesterase [Desulforhopalus sp.]